MIDVHFWPTPNGHKIAIFLEETGLPYRIIPVNIREGDQFQPEFLAISPNNKMPAIVDHDPVGGGEPVTLAESGAILVYLAEKSGKLLPPDGAERYRVLQWLMFQMASVGPMFGQAAHFRAWAAEKIPYAIDRYTNESNRLYAVLDKQLKGREYLAADYSIADIAVWPWIRYHENQGVLLDAYPNVQRWFVSLGGRPAMQRTLELLTDYVKPKPFDDRIRSIMFGAEQYARR